MSRKNPFLICCLALLVSFLLFLPCEGGVKNSPTRLGVWVTVFSPAEVLRSENNADKMLEICEKCGVDDIYIQVYRADKAYYDSSLTDRAPYEALLSGSGRDILDHFISRARDNNIRVHAWMNLLSIAQNRDSNIVGLLGEDVLTRDQYGRPAMPSADGKDDLDKYYIRENQLFLEPGDPRVAEYLTRIAREISGRYPGLAGLHLDYIRYPAAVPFIPGSRFTSHGLSYGYTPRNLSGFREHTGLDARNMAYSRGNFSAWDKWRRDRVTELVRSISESVKEEHPGMEISCTIVPSVERTYSTTFQDWTRWIREKYVDYVVAMDYTDDPDLMEIQAHSVMLSPLEDKVHIGIGAYLMKDDNSALEEEIKRLHEIGPAGMVIFSYDDIAANKELRRTLAGYFR